MIPMKVLALIQGLIGALFLGIAGAIIFNQVAFTFYNIYNHNYFADNLIEAGFASFLFLGLGIWLILKSVEP